MSEDGTQQGDPEAPPLFAETIHTLVKQLESKLDAHYGFCLLKNCSNMPKLLYFLRTSPCFLQNDFWNATINY